jgi:lipoprotein-anchoring transpeptidase ErfK/SrfK
MDGADRFSSRVADASSAVPSLSSRTGSSDGSGSASVVGNGDDVQVQTRTPLARLHLTHGRRATIVRGALVAATAAVVVGTCITLAVVARPTEQFSAPAAASSTAVAIPVRPGPFRALPADQVASLPEARYDAVIPGLLRYDSTNTTTLTHSATLAKDVALYGAAQKSAVAHLSATNFLGDPTTVVPVRADGAWTLILTPSRQQLPSGTNGDAAAQTAAWVRTDALTAGEALPSRVVVSVSEQTLSIVTGDDVATYQVGVGTTTTPTPTGVTGYLQARYLDPKQGQSVHPIELTSLHSAAKDEPFGGSDGGLIGVHFNTTSSGAVSHGCIRLTAEAITAVNRLPLGTPITITK